MEIKSKVYTRKNDSGTHYARIIVPKELRVFVHKPAMWRSLSTKVDKEAICAGTLVAAATQLVLQDVSDEYAEAAVVSVEAEILEKKLDLAHELKKINQDELAIVVASLKKSLGTLKVDDAGKTNGGSGGGTVLDTGKSNKKTAKMTADAKKIDAAKLDACDVLSSNQSESTAMISNSVDRYIEKRPHGVYRFRFWIPTVFQGIFGKREVRATLRTTDRTEAIEKAKPLFNDLCNKLARLQATNCAA